jgi:ankyrin repeat protein
VDARNHDGVTPLNLLLDKNDSADPALVERLLDAGADPNSTSTDGLRPLRSATAKDPISPFTISAVQEWQKLPGRSNYGERAVIDMLIARGGDVKHPRVVANLCKTGDIERVRLLLDGGYDVNSKDENSSLLDSAVLGSKVEMMQLLLERGAKIQPLALYHAREVEVLRLVLDRGCPVDTLTLFGFTALIKAAEDGDLARGRLLLERGANPRHADEQGNTALHTLARSSRARNGDDVKPFMAILVEHGADVNAQNSENKTPLDVALRSRRETLRDLGGVSGARR